MGEVVLLDFWVSPFGMRARIALAEKGIPFESREEENLAVGDKSPLLLKSNPIHKQVPVLLHGGRPVCESLNIVQYIDEAWPQTKPLLPPADQPYLRAQARFWADFIDHKMYESGTKLWNLKGEERGEAKKEYLGFMRILEGELGDKTFFGGESFGYVDVALVPCASWFYTHETFAGFSMEEECPKLMAWVKRCMQRDSVAKALPDPHKVYEFICDRRKMYGIE